MLASFADKIYLVFKFRKIKIIVSSFLLIVFNCGFSSAKNKCKADLIKLSELILEPEKFLNKDLTIEGEFYSFSTIPLDYEKAMKSSKDFIGLILARPDQTEIPLVELKLAAPLKMFKEGDLNIEHGDIISLEAKVYAVALGEPWLEVEEISLEKKAKEE